MPIPIRFYSVTKEEYDEIQKKMLQSEEEAKKHQGDVFFVEDRKDEGDEKCQSQNQ